MEDVTRLTRNAENSQRMQAARSHRLLANLNAALNYDPANPPNTNRANIGRMSSVCTNCSALKFAFETPGMCCALGKVAVPPHLPPPLLNQQQDDNDHFPLAMHKLFTGSDPNSENFLNNIRAYNNSFCMTSFAANEQSAPAGGTYNPTVRICGQVHHFIGALTPVAGQEPKFAQMYLYDDQEQRRVESGPTGQLRSPVIQAITNVMLGNPYVQDFLTANELMENDNNLSIVIAATRAPEGQHVRRFNAPQCNEVALLMVGETYGSRDILIAKRDHTLHVVPVTHRSYDPLQYPLFLPDGRDGYDICMRLSNDRHLTSQKYYCYIMQVRQGVTNYFHLGRRLWQQYLVDMWAKVELERLDWLRMNQQNLRVDDYGNLRDAVIAYDDVDVGEGARIDGEENQRLPPGQTGQRYILPSTFTGGPRYRHERLQDALTYVRRNGRPNLFITVTTNPNWIEIQQELLPSQKPEDRPDIVARVFKGKLEFFKNEVIKQGVFGRVYCWLYTVEWQKRGLPHAHCLLWTDPPIQPDIIDAVVQAEIPDQNIDPGLFQIVKAHMIHGPCGPQSNSPCMDGSRCRKMFPKRFSSETVADVEGYPLYRRRSPEEGGQVMQIRRSGESECRLIDNRWIVPYNSYLLRMMNCHANVEVCQSIKAIHYVIRYLQKGSDTAVFQLQNRNNMRDEIGRYLTGRYVSASEAAWRLLEFSIHERYPPVEQLPIHLENGQRVYFNENNVRDRAGAAPETMLTSFFSLCQEDDFAKQLLYHEVPMHYTWNCQTKQWRRRVNNTSMLGRIYTVHPTQQECFFLRLLLLHVRGPLSFSDLRSINGVQYASFRETCLERGLLQGDQHWHNCLSEASVRSNANQLRRLFCILLTACEVGNPAELLTQFFGYLTQDIRHHNPNYDDDAVKMCLLQKLQNTTLRITGKGISYYGLPEPQIIETSDSESVNQNEQVLQRYCCDRLTDEQRVIYDTVFNDVQTGVSAITFVEAAGGTGKTHLVNTLLTSIRNRGDVALAVASSGVASTLLLQGTTAHSLFKLPLNPQQLESRGCSVRRETALARKLAAAKLIVWDEATMSHKKSYEAVDRMLKDITMDDRAMGGKNVLLLGDFRQTLPVIRGGTRADTTAASLKCSHLWPCMRKMSLNTNLRVSLFNDQEAAAFSELLLRIGDGRIERISPGGERIRIPEGLCHLVNSVEELISNVYPQFTENNEDGSYFTKRAILAPLNADCDKINAQLLQQFPGEPTFYYSVDTVDDEEATHYPPEVLHSLNPNGLPSHELVVKQGLPLMILRNIDPPRLVNGTRCTVTTSSPNCLEVRIQTGPYAGENAFIPRIPLIATECPIEFKRLQFPVKVCFAMSINKAQGQTLDVAGLHLIKPCFSHGQLYVACSRVSSSGNIFILTDDGRTTKNVVYPEALQ